jgi:hypothetical protein
MHRNHKTDRGHYDGEGDRGQEVVQPAETSIETENKTEHWRILLTPIGHG